MCLLGHIIQLPPKRVNIHAQQTYIHNNTSQPWYTTRTHWSLCMVSPNRVRNCTGSYWKERLTKFYSSTSTHSSIGCKDWEIGLGLETPLGWVQDTRNGRSTRTASPIPGIRDDVSPKNRPWSMKPRPVCSPNSQWRQAPLWASVQ